MALKLISNEELGVVLFSYNIVVFLIPISGFGLNQGLLRYGALFKEKEEKNSLFLYVLKKGLLASGVLIVLIIISSFFISFKFENTQLYVITLSFIILPGFLFEIIRVQFRLQHNNKSYAYTELTHSITLLVSVFLLSYFFQEIGYTIALLLTPLISSFLFIKKLNIDFTSKIRLSITNFSFWKYGFFASLSNVLTQLLYAVDILLIGHLLEDTEMVTNYRYISLIPFSLLFLPRVFITTDFVTFTEKIHQKDYINRYIKNYMLFFGVVSILLLLFSYFFAEQILYIFGVEYMDYADSFLILIMGIVGIYIFRGLFGNLLSSIGKIELNYYIISIAIVINVISNYYLIPLYGIKGAAITSAILMWFTGILSWLSFLYFFRKNRYE